MVVKEGAAFKAAHVCSFCYAGVHWAGVEPVRGQYNQTYLDIMNGIIKRFQDNDIYTLVDQHQDVWAAQICGHGAPLVNNFLPLFGLTHIAHSSTLTDHENLYTPSFSHA